MSTSRIARGLRIFPYGQNIAAVVSAVMERDRQDAAQKRRAVVRIADPMREAKKARGSAKAAASGGSKPVPAAKPAAPGHSKAVVSAKAAAPGGSKTSIRPAGTRLEGVSLRTEYCCCCVGSDEQGPSRRCVEASGGRQARRSYARGEEGAREREGCCLRQ